MKDNSWCKYHYLRFISSNISSSGTDLGKPKIKSTNKNDQVIVQRDIISAVQTTLQRSKNAKPYLTAPQLESSIEGKNYPDIGQPTPFRQPHLFKSYDEVTPGITRKEYQERRYKLMTVLSESNFGRDYDNHLVLLSAEHLKLMSNDIPYSFHQDTDFLYLTGFNEPDAVLAIDFNKTFRSIQFLLFVKPKDPKRELWDGAVAGEKAAVDYFGADEAFPLSSLHSIMRDRYGYSKNYCVWYKTENRNVKKHDLISSILQAKWFHSEAQHNIGFNLQLLRLIKSPAEINIMKKSASIASQAFTKVMQNTRAGVPESHLHALLNFHCRIGGAQRLSFPPVVAGGSSANTLHYINNTNILRDGDLVLMDGGCEYNGYASDLTRTWPVSGTFSFPQRELYEIVLNVQKICLEACQPGVSIDHLHHVMLINMGTELQGVGLIQRNLTEIQLKRTTAEFCPHHLGHYLGMDTHDTMLLHKGLPLQDGMMFTLEPGLYIPTTNTNVPERYRGIGIRIEDDILMTKAGPYVLSAELPKEVEDVEELLSQKTFRK